MATLGTYALDTNCFIDAYDSTSCAQEAVLAVFDAAKHGRITLCVSKHTLSELTKDDEASKLAKTVAELPHFPIGTWKDQIVTWDKANLTWEMARHHNDLSEKLKLLAKRGVSIRDLGGFIDAVANGVDGFVTSDKGLVGAGPSKLINATFSTKVLTPDQLAIQILLHK